MVIKALADEAVFDRLAVNYSMKLLQQNYNQFTGINFKT
jgi:hypothetical protein